MMHLPLTTTRPTRPRGFTLTEVMFAVILLGVGFIMLAAMFPVAIQQSKSNVDESEAASIARGMANVAQQLGQYTTSTNLFKPTGTLVYSIADPQYDGTNKLLDSYNLWKSLSGDLINANDPRYASVLLYKRAANSYSAQLFVFVTQVRTRSQYSQAQDFNVAAPATYCNLQARGVNVSIADGTPDTITFNGGDFNAVAEGCYVVIANDTGSSGWMNGRVYRVGSYVGGTTWQLMPGNDFQADAGPDGVSSTSDDVTFITNADAFVVGRDITTGSYEGPAQDVAFYTTYISVR
jgi:prepilin-type N-terminal cleavage/methylation domain-containing protein